VGVVTATILSEGKGMDPEYDLLSLDITKEIDRIPRAEIVVQDGDAAKGDFPISNTPFFAPGKSIEIKLRYEGESDAALFKGIAVGQRIEAGPDGSRLSVTLKDTAVKLTQVRKGAVFRDQSDAQIIAKIIQDAALKKGTIPTTKPKHEEIVQYHATDWDFLLSRADVQGLAVWVDDGEISVNKIKFSGKEKHSFRYGMDEIYSLEIEADASGQYGDLESVAWDLKKQAQSKPAKASAFKLKQGNLDGKKLAGKVGFASSTLSHPVPLEAEELSAWADARMLRNRMSMLRGRLSVPGNAKIRPLDLIKLEGLGERFNGRTLVTGIRHRVSDAGWQTDLQFGLSPEWYCKKEGIAETPAAGLLPPVSGLQIGVVQKYEDDPEGELRLKLALPGVAEGKEALWARLATPDAGANRGFFFRPEVDDEVVVGFFNNDPRHPVVLGAMYGSKNAHPKTFPLAKDNEDKGIVSKGGIRIHLKDAKEPALVFETPEGNKIALDESEKGIQIVDMNGNEITLGKDGIVLKSAKDFKIEASGNVEIKGSQVDIK